MAKNAKYVEIGRRLKAAMRAAGMANSADLARALGVAHSRARNWQNGSARPLIDEGERVAQLLRVTIDYLYRGDVSGLSIIQSTRLKAAEDEIPLPSTDEDEQTVFLEKAKKKLAKAADRPFRAQEHGRAKQ